MLNLDQFNESILKAGYYAHYNTSFDPKRRAEQELNIFKNTCNNFFSEIDKQIILEEQKEKAKEYFINKFKEKFLNYLNARSRCISVMITGSGNFPVARNEKNNKIANKRSEELEYFKSNFIKKLKSYYNIVDNNIIKSSDDDAIDKLEAKIKMIEVSNNRMKLINGLYKKYGIDFTNHIELTDIELKNILWNIENCWSKKPYSPYSFSNNSQNKRRLQQRLEQLKKRQNVGNQEFNLDEGKIVFNVNANRVQIYFNGKPDDQIRKSLKANGFRWTPSISAWQAYYNYKSKKYTIDFFKLDIEIKVS